MRMIKCDRCEKIIELDYKVPEKGSCISHFMGYLGGFDLCEDCGKTVREAEEQLKLKHCGEIEEIRCELGLSERAKEAK